MLLVKRANGSIDDDTPLLADGDPALATLDMVWQRFGSFGTQHMNLFIQAGNSPWSLAWNAPDRNDRDSITLANSEIRRWFRSLLIQENKDRAASDGLEDTVLIAKLNLAETISPAK